jgi:PAS domain S-box-containing protein
MGRATRNVAAAGFALVLALLVANAVVTSRNVWTLHHNQARVAKTRAVLGQVAHALSLLKDAETGQRGYLLTGRDDYLEPYRAAAAAIGPALERLADLTADNPRQARHTAELRRLAADRMAVLERSLAARRGPGPGAAIDLAASDRGKALMDQARAVTAAIEAEENRVLEERTERSGAALGRTITAFAVATGLALVLLVAVAELKRRDDAGRERAAEAIRREREWLATTVASIGDAVVATDGSGRVRLINPIASALTGWTHEEAAGRPVQEVVRIIHEVTRTPAPDPVARVIREGRAVGRTGHTVVVARDGTETAVEESAAPLEDAAGRVVGVVMVFRDVTRERAAQRLARESGDRLRMAVESAGLGTWDYNPVTGELAWDERCKAIFGLAPDAPVDYETFLAALHPDDRRRVDEAVKTALDPAFGGTLAAEYRVIRVSDHAERWVASRARAYFEEHGWAIRLIGTVLDVTAARRAAEDLREAKDEAEDASRAKDQFLGVLSHELRTPLNPILLAVTSMLERPATPPEEVRPDLEMIRHYVNLQARLIDDLLDVNRIVRGKMPLHWEVADCHALVEEAVEICQGELAGKNLVIERDLGAADHHINADPARLQQVFWNLLKNAIKFSPGGGTVAVRTRNDDEPDATGRRLVIEVSDTGIGIEPEVLPSIFEPFKQGESSITRRFGGMGLGLAISKGIVEGHGGLLSVRSDGKGRGATFRVELRALPRPKPAPGHPPRPAAPAGAPPAGPGPRKVLVVEDEPATLRLMTRLLRRLGHDVTTADSLAAALGALDGREFDLIISDIGLPDGSGLDLMRAAVARLGPRPAIALTGYGMEEDVRRSLDAGFTAHLTKPIDFAVLEAMIADVTKAPG